MSGCTDAGRVPAVAIAGGGLSGTLVAANLLRHARRPLRVLLIERGGDFGPGVAYSTTDPCHRLNVPAARMSAFCDAPLHLLSWARRHLGRHVAADEFLPRAVYGEYLRALLADERERAPAATLEPVAGEVERLTPTARGVAVELADGRALTATAAVLATGNLPPATAPGLPDDPRVVADPWAPGALDRLAGGGTTLVVGTSLTAVDVALSAAGAGRDARVIAVSRRGLLPRVHLPGLRDPAPPPALPEGPLGLAQLERIVRRHDRHMRAEGYDWRDVVDGIRPCVPALWQRLPLAHRRRFLAGPVRAWDVRRHRLAPAVGAEIAALRAAGRLETVAAPLLGARAERDGIAVELGGDPPLTVRADRVVCCTGAGGDIRAVPAIDRLVASGAAVPDALGLGLRAGRCGRLLDAAGSTRAPLYTLGPTRRGELWETTAAREIRAQAEYVARDILRGVGSGARAPAPPGHIGQAPEPGRR